MASTTAKKTTAKAKTTAKSASKKATKTASAKATETNNSVENVTAAAQERYFSVLEQGQTVALDGFSTVVETMNRVSDIVTEQIDRVDVASLPGMNVLSSNLPKLNISSDMPAEMVESYFEFANKALANQREFANKALAIATKS